MPRSLGAKLLAHTRSWALGTLGASSGLRAPAHREPSLSLSEPAQTHPLAGAGVSSASAAPGSASRADLAAWTPSPAHCGTRPGRPQTGGQPAAPPQQPAPQGPLRGQTGLWACPWQLPRRTFTHKSPGVKLPSGVSMCHGIITFFLKWPLHCPHRSLRGHELSRCPSWIWESLPPAP